MIKGVPLSPGIARGTAYLVNGDSELAAPHHTVATPQIAGEMARFRAACRTAAVEVRSLREEVERRAGAAVSDIFQAQALMLADPLFLGQVCRRIESEGLAAEAALLAVLPELTESLESLGDAYFRDRAADLRDVARRVLRALGSVREAKPEIPADAILVTADLEPSLVANLDPNNVVGVVTEHGAENSHAAILLRSFGVPAVGGVPGVLTSISAGSPLLVDGIAGLAFIAPEKGVLEEYERLAADLKAHDERLAGEVSLPAVTRDGAAIKLAANLGKLADTAAALQCNADGVGLYRTEFAFDIRDQFPSEEEQRAILEEVAGRLHPRQVVFRILDLGADKTFPYFPLPPVKNPALHLRGIRLMLRHRDVLRTQLRAILRTSAAHPVGILLPMVGDLQEVRELKEILAEAKASLTTEGVAFDPSVPVGAMIEIPGAAIVAEELAGELDFLSLGTNDLVQYLLAADRDDPAMSGFYRCLHPAVVRTIASVVGAARRAGKPLAICGEMAGDPFYTELLIGLGLRSFSVSPRQLASIKHELRRTDTRAAARLARRALRLRSKEEILRFLERRRSRRQIAVQ